MKKQPLARQQAAYRALSQRLRSVRAELAASSAAIVSRYLSAQAAAESAESAQVTRAELNATLEQLQAAINELELAANASDKMRQALASGVIVRRARDTAPSGLDQSKRGRGD